MSVGGGGAYLNHAIGHEDFGSNLVSATGWGGQVVASGDYGMTRSGRLRAGLTGRYYYLSLFGNTERFLTIGPQITFSFR
jgi:hypothetical protein